MAAESSESSLSTRTRLLARIDDMERLTEHLLEQLLGRQQEGTGTADTTLQTLIEKDAELKEILQEHVRNQEKVEKLEQEVRKMDSMIHDLQEQLHLSEQIVSHSVYQARQKLAAIRQANSHPIPVEELIKYSKDLLESGSVAAPDQRSLSDKRGPYPTPMDMWLGRLGQADEAKAPKDVRKAMREFQQRQQQRSRQREQQGTEKEEVTSSQYSASNTQGEQEGEVTSSQSSDSTTESEQEGEELMSSQSSASNTE